MQLHQFLVCEYESYGLKNLTTDNIMLAVHDPHHYTSGRWLCNDELQRRSRFVDFHFTELCKRAIDVCPGAERLVRYEKKEGASNRVFVMLMDNGVKVVARVPFSVAGPPRLTTNSEVATMRYCKVFHFTL